MRPERCKLVLLPRDHLKTSIGVIDNSLYRGSKNPIEYQGETFYNGDSMFFAHYSKDMMKDTFHELRVNLESNTKLHTWYPYLKIDKVKDKAVRASAERIFLRRPIPSKEPSFYATSVESTSLGGHYDMFYLDDALETDKTKDSPELVKKINRFWKGIAPLFKRSAQSDINISGTPHECDGLYSKIEASTKNEDTWTKILKKAGLQFIVVKRPMVEYVNGKKVAICPKIMSIEDMEARRSPLWMGNREVEAQYMLNPLPDEELFFSDNSFRFIDEKEIPGTVFNRYLLVDPATSLKKGAHHAALVVGDINEFADLVIRDCVLKRYMGTDGIVDEIFRLHKKWSPGWVYVEEYAMKSITQWVRHRGKQEGYPIIAQEFKHDSRSKESRIGASTDWFNTGKVYFMTWMQNTEFHKQFLTYYAGKKEEDDAPDLTARFFDRNIMIIPKPKKKNEDMGALTPEKMLMAAYIRKQNEYNLINFGIERMPKAEDFSIN